MTTNHNKKYFDIRERTLQFSIQIIKVINSLPKNTVGQIIGKQLMRSGTSIGANLEEAQSANTKKDFVHKISISLNEARETNYWLQLLIKSGVSQAKKY